MNKTEVIGTLMLKLISTISRMAKLTIFKRRVQVLPHEAPNMTMQGIISINHNKQEIKNQRPFQISPDQPPHKIFLYCISTIPLHQIIIFRSCG